MPNISLIVLDNFYDCANGSYAQAHFGSIIGLKIRGFSSHYDYGALPFGTPDFVATHFTLMDDSEKKPIMTFKILSLKRCQIFQLEFPALSLVKEDDNHEHEIFFKELTQRCLQRGEDLLYHGGFTVHPDYRKDRRLMHTVFQVVQLIQCKYARECLVKQSIMFITKDKNFRHYFEEIGFHPVRYNYEELPPVKVPSIGGELTCPYYAIDLTNIEKDSFRFLGFFWDNRRILTGQSWSKAS